MGYGLLKYVTGEEGVRERVRGMGETEVAFNYLGQLDGGLSGQSTLFSQASESTGEVQSKQGLRHNLLEINGGISGGRLRVFWSYSENIHRRSTIKAVADEFIEELRKLIAHCRRPEAGGYTPSDFPLARIKQSQLDQLVGTNRQVEDIYPLSPMQQGMLFHTLYAPESGMYCFR